MAEEITLRRKGCRAVELDNGVAYIFPVCMGGGVVIGCAFAADCQTILRARSPNSPSKPHLLVDDETGLVRSSVLIHPEIADDVIQASDAATAFK
jgi:hypothetical protein